jgi:hypothetical protein
LTRSQHNSFIAWDRSHDVFHEYKLPCICPVYDIGFKVLSMKITTLHHSNISISIRGLSMKISSHFFVAWDRSHDVFYNNKLPYICSMYDTGVKVLSMKINYLAPFKHKHKHLKPVHEN